jgi:hypothetical protein
MCFFSIIDTDFKKAFTTPFARADDGDDDDQLSLDPSNGGLTKRKGPLKDFFKELDQSNGPNLRIESIYPPQGPIMGKYSLFF